MQIKFNNFNQVKEYLRMTHNVESDLLIKCGSYVVDGKSALALYSLNLEKELTLEVIEKKEGEEDEIMNFLKLSGIEVAK